MLIRRHKLKVSRILEVSLSALQVLLLLQMEVALVEYIPFASDKQGANPERGMYRCFVGTHSQSYVDIILFGFHGLQSTIYTLNFRNIFTKARGNRSGGGLQEGHRVTQSRQLHLRAPLRHISIYRGWLFLTTLRQVFPKAETMS